MDLQFNVNKQVNNINKNTAQTFMPSSIFTALAIQKIQLTRGAGTTRKCKYF